MAALARSVLRYSARHEAAASDNFADHVIAGLGEEQKWLSAKYFYDATGSELFEQITGLPEYYPTRTELKILETNAPAMSGYIPLSAALVEFGTGSTRKARLLIDAAPQLAAYVPVDISAEFLSSETMKLHEDLPDLVLHPIAADFTKPFALTVRLFANMVAGHIVIFFLIALTVLISPFIAPVSVAFALGIYLLELFVALVQAYVFTMLSAVFIGMTQHAH